MIFCNFAILKIKYYENNNQHFLHFSYFTDY